MTHRRGAPLGFDVNLGRRVAQFGRLQDMMPSTPSPISVEAARFFDRLLRAMAYNYAVLDPYRAALLEEAANRLARDQNS